IASPLSLAGRGGREQTRPGGPPFTSAARGIWYWAAAPLSGDVFRDGRCRVGRRGLGYCALRAASLDQGHRDALLGDLAGLINDLPLPGDDAAPPPAAHLFLDDARPQFDRVADEDRLLELPVADGDEGQRAHHGAVDGEAGGDRKDEHAVGDGPAERRGAGELVIEVDRVEVAAEAGEVDDVGLRHGAARRQPLLT